MAHRGGALGRMARASGGRLLCACGLLLAWGGSSASAWQEAGRTSLEGITGDERVLGALEELWSLEGPEGRSEAIERVSELLPDASAACFSALAITYGTGAGEPCAALHREALVEALAGRQSRALESSIEAAVASNEPALHCAALRMLAEIGQGSEVELLFETVAARRGQPEPDPQVRGLFEDALSRLLGRDPQGFASLGGRDRDLPQALEIAVVRAVGPAGRVEGLPYLLDALEWGHVPAETVLAEIARLATVVPRPCVPDLGQPLIDRLQPDQPQTCQAAAQALGRLRCTQALPALIELLEADHRGVRETAHWALRQITGQGLVPDAERWRSWNRTELEWFASRGPAITAGLASGDPASISESLSEVAAHALFAEDFAPALAEALAVPVVETRLFALHVIGLVRAAGAAPSLLPLLAGGDPSVVERTLAILLALTGIEGPETAGEWEQALARWSDCWD